VGLPQKSTAARFAYEWHDDSGNWFRSYGNETGNLIQTAAWRGALLATTIYQFVKRVENFTGLKAVALMIIRAFLTLDFNLTKFMPTDTSL
jgi:hypothetical protein